MSKVVGVGCKIDKRACIGENVYIGDNVKIYGNVTVGEQTIIEDNVIIGEPTYSELMLLREDLCKKKISTEKVSIEKYVTNKTSMGKKGIIRQGSTIWSGVKIGDNFDCYRNVSICPGTQIWNNVYVMDNTLILLDVRIGNNCRINGFCCDGSVIEDNVSMLGWLVHEYDTPIDGRIEPAPVIKKGATVGMLAVVIGDVTIGEGAYVGAGAVITKSVPPNALVVGHQQLKKYFKSSEER